MPETPNLDAQVNGPQYLGPATFMKVRALAEPAELDRAAPDAAIVGAPWYDGTTYRPGARFGPRAVRVANYQPPSWHLDLEIAPFDVLRVVDYGDAVCYPGLTDQAHEAIRARVAEIASRKIVPMVIGGDHSITYPAATAVADAYGRGKVGLVHFDAHADTGKSSWGNLASHATPMRRLIESGAIPEIALRTKLVGMDVVEVSPPYDHAEITAQNANRCILDAISALAVKQSRGGKP